MKHSGSFFVALAVLAVMTWANPVLAHDAIDVTGFECPGLGFLAGSGDFTGSVVTSGPDVDVGQICDALNGGLQSGFGPIPAHLSARDLCIASGGRWINF